MSKNFKKDISPVMQFIDNSSATPNAVPLEPLNDTKPPAGYKLNPLFVEKRSRRLQLTIQPSLYVKIKSRADAEGISINELVHSLLEKSL